MADEKPKNKEATFTGDWYKDVGTWKNEKQKERTHFYTQAALLSLRVESEDDIKAALKDPEKYKISKKEAIDGAASYEHQIKKGDTLGVILKDFFTKLNTGADVVRDMKVTLYEFTKQVMNVDLIRAGGKAVIAKGDLIISDDKGTEVGRYALRPDGAATDDDSADKPKKKKKPKPKKKKPSEDGGGTHQAPPPHEEPLHQPPPDPEPPVEAHPRPQTHELPEPEAPASALPVPVVPAHPSAAAPEPVSAAPASAAVKLPAPAAGTAEPDGGFTIRLDDADAESDHEPVPASTETPAYEKELRGYLQRDFTPEERTAFRERADALMTKERESEGYTEEYGVGALIKKHREHTLSPAEATELNFLLVDQDADKNSGKHYHNTLREQDRLAMTKELLEGSPDDIAKARILIYLCNSYLAMYYDGTSWAKALDENAVDDLKPDTAATLADFAIKHIKAVKDTPVGKKAEQENYGVSFETMLNYAYRLEMFALAKAGRGKEAIKEAKKSPQYKYIMEDWSKGDFGLSKWDGSREFIDHYLEALEDPANSGLRDTEIYIVLNAHKSGSLRAPKILNAWWRSSKDPTEGFNRLAIGLGVNTADIEAYVKRHPEKYQKLFVNKENPFARAPGSYVENRYLWLIELGDSYGPSVSHYADKRRLYNQAFDMNEQSNVEDAIRNARKESVLKRISETINQGFYHNTRYSGWIRGKERGENIRKDEKGYVVDLDYMVFDPERNILVAQYVDKGTNTFGKVFVLKIHEDGSVYYASGKDRINFYDTDGSQLFFDPIAKKLVAVKEGEPKPFEIVHRRLAEMLAKHYNQQVTYGKNDITFSSPIETPIFESHSKVTSIKIGPAEAASLYCRAKLGTNPHYFDVRTKDYKLRTYETVEEIFSAITGEKIEPKTQSDSEATDYPVP